MEEEGAEATYRAPVPPTEVEAVGAENKATLFNHDDESAAVARFLAIRPGFVGERLAETEHRRIHGVDAGGEEGDGINDVPERAKNMRERQERMVKTQEAVGRAFFATGAFRAAAGHISEGTGLASTFSTSARARAEPPFVHPVSFDVTGHSPASLDLHRRRLHLRGLSQRVKAAHQQLRQEVSRDARYWRDLCQLRERWRVVPVKTGAHQLARGQDLLVVDCGVRAMGLLSARAGTEAAVVDARFAVPLVRSPSGFLLARYPAPDKNLRRELAVQHTYVAQRELAARMQLRGHDSDTITDRLSAAIAKARRNQASSGLEAEGVSGALLEGTALFQAHTLHIEVQDARAGGDEEGGAAASVTLADLNPDLAALGLVPARPQELTARPALSVTTSAQEGAGSEESGAASSGDDGVPLAATAAAARLHTQRVLHAVQHTALCSWALATLREEAALVSRHNTDAQRGPAATAQRRGPGAGRDTYGSLAGTMTLPILGRAGPAQLREAIARRPALVGDRPLSRLRQQAAARRDAVARYEAEAESAQGKRASSGAAAGSSSSSSSSSSSAGAGSPEDVWLWLDECRVESSAIGVLRLQVGDSFTLTIRTEPLALPDLPDAAVAPPPAPGAVKPEPVAPDAGAAGRRSVRLAWARSPPSPLDVMALRVGRLLLHRCTALSRARRAATVTLTHPHPALLAASAVDTAGGEDLRATLGDPRNLPFATPFLSLQGAASVLGSLARSLLASTIRSQVDAEFATLRSTLHNLEAGLGDSLLWDWVTSAEAERHRDPLAGGSALDAILPRHLRRSQDHSAQDGRGEQGPEAPPPCGISVAFRGREMASAAAHGPTLVPVRVAGQPVSRDVSRDLTAPAAFVQLATNQLQRALLREAAGSLDKLQAPWDWLEEPDVLWAQDRGGRVVHVAAASAASSHLEWSSDTDFAAIGLARGGLLVAWRGAGDGAGSSWREAAPVGEHLVLVLHRAEGARLSDTVAALLQ